MNNLKPHRQFNWPIFLFGLVLGIAVFASFSYFKLARQINNSSANGAVSGNTDQVFNFTLRANEPIWGNPEAKVSLVVFQDFTCPYCREYNSTLENFMADYSDQVRIIFRHFPLNQKNPSAISSANASECAGEQGKFWDFARELYQADDFVYDFYIALAAKLNLDSEQFKTCLDSNTYADKITADYSEGIIKNVEGTPTTFINGRYFAGAFTQDKLVELIAPLLD